MGSPDLDGQRKGSVAVQRADHLGLRARVVVPRHLPGPRWFRGWNFGPPRTPSAGLRVCACARNVPTAVRASQEAMSPAAFDVAPSRASVPYAATMSKVEAQRAMREARYAANAARYGATNAPAKTAAPTAVEAIPMQAPEVADVGTQATDDVETLFPVKISAPAEPISPVPSPDLAVETQLCGHRNIGNKSCRRPAGHVEKNHRYK